MILTYNKAEDCSSIIIYDSEELLDFYNDINLTEPTGYKAELGITCNCGNEVTYDIDSTIVMLDSELNTAYVTINNALINDLITDQPLSDGIYKIRLKVTEPDESYVEDYFCTAILCEIECELITYLSNNLKSDAYKYLIALQNIDNCDKCECEAGCLLYEELVNIIEDGNYSNCCDS